MKTKDLSEASVEILTKQQKAIKLLTGVLIGMLSTLLAIGIFLTIQQGKFSIFTVIPFCLLPIVIMNFSTLKKIKAELTSRDNLR